jgi:cytoskeletal protein RodZ
MNSFLITEIKNKTVGEILKETREELDIDIDKAAVATKINRNYIIAFEKGDYKKLPGGVYSEKILEIYANFLNIDFSCLKKAFLREMKAIRGRETETFIPKISRGSLIVTPKLVSIFLAIFAVIGFFIYLAFGINNIFSPPDLEILSPKDNLITSNPTVVISGKTESEVKIKINDQEIERKQDGFFSETVSLSPGINVIKISAAKKRSRENVIYRRVVLENSNLK